MAYRCAVSGRYNEAIEFYDQALAGVTEDAENQSILLSNKAAALMGLKRFKEALEISSQAIQRRPNWSKSWFRAGRVLFEMKSFASALKVFKAALLKDPKNEEIQNWIQKTELLAAKVR